MNTAIKNVGAALLIVPALSMAQSSDNYPNRTVNIVVPFGAGSSTDIEGRVYVNELSKSLGQQFIMDFRPGAVMTVGLQYAAKQKPDGYTLVMTGPAYSVLPLLNIERSFDPIKDFDAISLISKRSALMVVSNNMPIHNVKDYISYAKANPGKINFATGGQGAPQHLTGAWLESITGTNVTFVHYKAIGNAYPDLIAGRVDMTFTSFSTGLPMVKAGKVRAIAIASLQRNSALPDMPTADEQGLPGLEYSTWLAMFTVAKTPPVIVNKLHAELVKIAKSPEIREKMGNEVMLVALGPAELRKYTAAETERWRRITAEKNIKLDAN